MESEKHGKRQVWRKLHFTVDTDIHEIIAAKLALPGVTDAEVLPSLRKKIRRTVMMKLMIQETATRQYR